MPLDKIEKETKKAPENPGLSSLTTVTAMDGRFYPQILAFQGGFRT
jgi:hypothetical protein